MTDEDTKRSRWLRFLFARKSMQRDQDEDDRGMESGSWETALFVVIVLVGVLALLFWN